MFSSIRKPYCYQRENHATTTYVFDAPLSDEFVALGGSILAAAQDVLETVLQKVDAAALCRLKAASVAWCAHVRRELCNRLWVRLCRREGQPEPAGVESITDLDLECLNDAGRPWEVVIAGRQLPQLARLHGYGFVVDVQAVREADLEEEDDDAPLGGVALRSCIQGEGQPPDELLLAAVACAASGTVRGVPVQRLREDDAIDELDLRDSGIGDIEATLLGLMLPAATSLRSLEYATGFPCQFPLTLLSTCLLPLTLISPSQPLSVLLISLLCALVSQRRLQRHHGRRCRESGRGGARARQYDRLLRDPARILPTPWTASPNCVRRSWGAP